MLAESTIQTLNQYLAMYERAVSLSGRPRERMVALGEADELFYRLYPYHYRALQTVRVAAQLGRTATVQTDVMRRCESRLMRLVMGVIQEGSDAGDLELGHDGSAQSLAFSMWALAFGTRALMNTAVARFQLGIEPDTTVARDMASLMLDAVGWRPLAAEWDYEHTLWRIRTGLFAEEWRRASAA